MSAKRSHENDRNKHHQQQLSTVRKDVLERVHHAFIHDPIQVPGSILYKAGLCLSSHEMYEYRKTLFPPDALVDPLTQDPPILRDPDLLSTQSILPILPISEPDRSADSLSAEPTSHQSADSLSASPVAPPTSRRNGLGLEDITPWPDPVDSAALLDELRQVLRRYVVLPGMAPETLALWVVHTYAFELRNVSTYIGLGSPQKRCGKTTLLTVLTELVSRPVVASNISPPAYFALSKKHAPPS
jgi:hypothetical protein